ncbi:MAG TPA: phosphoribosylanthranilate isomerase [Candidatus Binatia bacterium]|jgi:phosphoribosylanthranilate isomerase
MVKVKVCGITNLADAEKALEYGADALGFNFYPPSSRSLAPEKAGAILRQLPADAWNVALFVNEAKERIKQILAKGTLPEGRCGYQTIQFHGDESADDCRGWGIQVIKAFRLKDKQSLKGIHDFPADYYLLDSWSSGYGGSGMSFPWEWLEGFDTGKIILSGGLDLDNVAEAVRRLHPYGVDVCSGVEVRPGVKDHEKIKRFISAAKETA